MNREPRAIYSLRLRPSEKAELEAYAESQGFRTLAEMMRSTLLRLARRDRAQRAA